MLLAGTIFSSPARAWQSSAKSDQQASSSPAQQAPASSVAQDSSAPAKPADKTTPDAKPAKTPAKKSAATAASKTDAAPKTASQAADAPKASSSASAPAASTKAAPSATAKAGQAATAKTAKTGASKTATTKTAVPLTLKTDKDKQSYAIGINVGKGLGQNLKQTGLEIDPAILTRAIKDVLSGGTQSMTDQEAQETLKALQADLRAKQEEMRKEQEAKMKVLGEANKKEGDEFLAANKVKEGVTALPDGLQYKILQEGTGPKPAATDAVTVNYRGTLVDGTEFDSSYKRGQPATFNVTGIIKGWTEALELMPVGSKWQLVIPSDLAYGPSGRPPMIGPNSTLVFEVELVSIQPRPAAPAPVAAPTPNPAAAAAPNAPTPNPAPTANSPAPAPKPAPPTPKPEAPAPTPKPPTP
ncbi:MAG TPA: FKBP-type peptidyl-prolyl cis-trans isomerase [Candidatus Acidoferrum sp.]|nr:FKBP-type peptidyl-prolyl cis-trans isomerase [Candidatus Acidoferrum sp.]